MGRMEWSEGGEWDNCNSIINKYIFLKKKNSGFTVFFPSACSKFLRYVLYLLALSNEIPERRLAEQTCSSVISYYKTMSCHGNRINRHLFFQNGTDTWAFLV